jgi:tetratricopeptide (TPR) repeat protein
MTVTLAAAMLSMVFAGCLQGAIDANQRQLKDQQAQLDQLMKEVKTLQNQQTSYATALPPAGACDHRVMAVATQKGGDRMVVGDTTKALGYYHDAVTACPTSAQAQLNLANAYEAAGDRIEAMRHYRIAAVATGPEADAEAVRKAREALARMGVPAS